MTQTTDTQPHPVPRNGVETRAHLVTDHDWDATAVPSGAAAMRAHNLAHAAEQRQNGSPTTGGNHGLKTLILIWNALMGVWLGYALVTTNSVMRDCDTRAYSNFCRAGASIGSSLVVNHILTVALVVNVILGVIWMVTKPQN
jgi:hypothetical protein